eukprot:4192744-Prymnesium_polylepis.1
MELSGERTSSNPQRVAGRTCSVSFLHLQCGWKSASNDENISSSTGGCSLFVVTTITVRSITLRERTGHRMRG